jgi:hypothetical protein
MDSKLIDSLLESPGRLRRAAIEDAGAAASFGARERVLAVLRRRRERVKRLIRFLDEETLLEEGAGRAARAASRCRRRSLSANSPARAA